MKRKEQQADYFIDYKDLIFTRNLDGRASNPYKGYHDTKPKGFGYR